MKKEALPQNPYLSCVEAYYLAWLHEFFDVRKLYVESFAEIEQVANDFANDVKYENYNGFARVQDTGEKLGIIKHKIFNGDLCCHCEGRSPAAISYGIQPRNLTLIKVNEKFFRGNLTAWRDDHFIAATEVQEEKLYYVNHYPLSCGELTQAQLFDVYGGTMLAYAYCDKFNVALYDKKRAETLMRLKETPQSNCFKTLSGAALRDALGVLKISRERMRLWLLSEGYDLPELNEQVSDLQRLYFKLGADIVRGKNNADYANVLENIILNEKAWRQKL
ncbi:hypothetical protein [Pumilibacter muris]|uniref:hypothetical protein n=1 Tax=Pumilibacter muris TaxID=2941510 RepID=UPI00203FB167|nr:hypothetical protein [Pumilibacter muris]